MVLRHSVSTSLTSTFWRCDNVRMKPDPGVLHCTSSRDNDAAHQWPQSPWYGAFPYPMRMQLHAPATINLAAVLGSQVRRIEPSLEYAYVFVVFQYLPTIGTRHHRRRGAISFQAHERLRQSTLALRRISPALSPVLWGGDEKSVNSYRRAKYRRAPRHCNGKIDFA